MEKLTEYWDARYRTGGNSGAGSYGEEALLKASMINHWIKELDIRTINEIGSGDGNNLLMYNVRSMYTGYDISKKSVEICLEKTRKIHNSLMYYFTTEWKDMDFDAELCLCLDVWYHQIEDSDFEELCHTLFEVGMWKYIIIYSTDTNSQFTQDGIPLAKHVRFREVLSKIAEYPQWNVKYWISGIQVNQEKNIQFPSDKRFYLLERKKDLEIPKE